MPARVRIPQRIVTHIGIPVQALRVARIGHDGVGLGKAPEGEGGVAGLAGRGLCGWEGAGRVGIMIGD